MASSKSCYNVDRKVVALQLRRERFTDQEKLRPEVQQRVEWVMNRWFQRWARREGHVCGPVKVYLVSNWYQDTVPTAVVFARVIYHAPTEHRKTLQHHLNERYRLGTIAALALFPEWEVPY